MRRYKNKLFAILLSVLAVISFTSCTNDDYEWREGTMNFDKTITTAPNGVIRESLYIDYSWVKTNGRYDYIDDIRYYSGQIEVRTNDPLGIVRLSVSNSNAFVDLDIRRGGGIYEGRQIEDFLYAVVEVVRRYGDATIYVDGRALNFARFDLKLLINIDAYVSY